MAQSIKYAQLEVELGILAQTGMKLSALGTISDRAGTICAAMACCTAAGATTSVPYTIRAALAAAGTMCIPLAGACIFRLTRTFGPDLSFRLRPLLSLLLRHNAVAMFSSNF